MSAISEAAADDTQAVRIIKRFGGLTKAARAWKKSKSTVQRWQQSGYIHPDYYDDILAAAVIEQVRLDPNDFNVVDTNHPAFNAPCSASPDSTAGRDAGSCQRPKPEIELSPPADQCPEADARGFSRGVSSSSEQSLTAPGQSGAE